MNSMHLAGTVALVVAALGAGYWLGTRAPAPDSMSASTTPGPASPADATQPGKRKILFYRNPMGLPDTSPVPKKDPMGMDYVPVYEGEQPAAGATNELKISTEKIQKLGVRTEPARIRVLDRQIRAAGRVEPDERRTFSISPKFEGYVERLHVNATGQVVSKGQPLFEVYSPELISAQREYAIAAQGVQALKDSSEETRRGMQQLAESSIARLKNWDVSEEQIKSLTNSQQSKRTLTFRSPVSGIVTEKKAIQGMRFEPGQALYQVTDLSMVWVIADVFEQDIGWLKSGTKASISIPAYADKRFQGTVSYVYPTLNATTRTIPIRVELANPQGLLKPGMFAQVELAVGSSEPVLTVPNSAVIDSGVRALVLVQRAEGSFEPREVKLGGRGAQYVQVLNGVEANEEVVVAANFLIDAESNLKAAVGGFGHAAHGAGAAGSQAAPSGAPASAPQATPPTAPSKAVSHQAEGQIESLDVTAGSITLKHEAIASLKWPAMTMEFKLANAGLAQGLKAGQAVSFEFVERAPGEFVITRIGSPPGATTAPTASEHANSHGGR
ncbi:efflux RND transporter periplasmic adaptor subunit [Variovorax robiniae]|uniref:Efflux RND transporter periplasmic adaptor subunit n=1 Tax=Variovorax robiniae TaxID=1836199 RepID=A0ABU8XIU4_9BURK